MGLLDITDDPQQMGLLSLGLRLMSTPGNFGRAAGIAGLGALQDMRDTQDQALKAKLTQAQLGDVTAQAEVRKQQAARAARSSDMLSGLLGGQQQPSQYGLAGNGVSMGGVREPMVPRPGGLAGASPEQIAALKADGVDLSNLWELARFGKEMQPGYRRNVDGSLSYFGDPTKGYTVDSSGRVSLMPGTLESQTRLGAATTMASELPKALIQAGTRTESLSNPDGTTRTLSGLQALSEGGGLDALRGVFGDSVPGAPTQQPQSQAGPNPAKLAAVRADMVRNGIANAAYSLDGSTGDISAKPGITSGVPTQTKVATETLGKVNDAWLKTSYEPTVNAGNTARDVLGSVKTARFALSGLGDTGFGTGAKQAAARVLGSLGVPNAEAYAANGAIFQKAAGDRLFTLLGEQKGPQTEGDAERGRTLFASIAIPKQANQYILDLTEAKAEWDRRRAVYYQEAMPFAQRKGDLQEIDRRWQRIAPSVFDLPMMQKWKDRLK